MSTTPSRIAGMRWLIWLTAAYLVYRTVGQWIVWRSYPELYSMDEPNHIRLAVLEVLAYLGFLLGAIGLWRGLRWGAYLWIAAAMWSVIRLIMAVHNWLKLPVSELYGPSLSMLISWATHFGFYLTGICCLARPVLRRALR